MLLVKSEEKKEKPGTMTTMPPLYASTSRSGLLYSPILEVDGGAVLAIQSSTRERANGRARERAKSSRRGGEAAPGDWVCMPRDLSLPYVFTLHGLQLTRRFASLDAWQVKLRKYMLIM